METDGTSGQPAAPAAVEEAGHRVIRLPVEGMSCGACAAKVERALRAVPGVEEATVNFASEEATVRTAPGLAGTRPLVEAVEHAGYGVREEETELAVEGMHCASCVARVEAELAAVRGVTGASVNLAAETALVRAVPGALRSRELVEAVERAGYEATIVGPEARDNAAREGVRVRELADLKRRFWVAAALTAPLVILEMLPHSLMLLGLGGHGWPGLDPWVQLLLTTPVVVYSGQRFFRGAWKGLWHRSADMNTLIAVGTGAAYAYSAVAP